MFLEIVEQNELDPNKENVFLFLSNHFDKRKYRIHSFTFPIIETLFEKYNVAVIGGMSDFKYFKNNGMKPVYSVKFSIRS
jgi:hypothetical protein